TFRRRAGYRRLLYTTLFRSMSEHELVIRGGVVVDGTGGGSMPADVAVDGGRITTIVPHRRGVDRPAGHRVIDAAGQVIAPGFIRSEEHTSELQSRENLVCRL